MAEEEDNLADQMAAQMAEEPSKDEASQPAAPSGTMEAVYDIPVELCTVLGKSKIKVSDLLKLDKGAVMELGSRIGEPVELYCNNQLVARGELQVINDRLAVTMTEIIKSNITKL
jgi:flagellar motor switch protein FliN/FliY